MTKYRYQILHGDVTERSRDLLRQICVAREVMIIRGAVSPDLIHMLAYPPQQAPSELVQFLRGGHETRESCLRTSRNAARSSMSGNRWALRQGSLESGRRQFELVDVARALNANGQLFRPLGT